MKAIALVSGGLDSLLAARLIEKQGVEVILVNFKIPFCHSKPGHGANRLFGSLGPSLRIIELSEDFLEIVKNPVYGYGSNINPCIDCKILMLRKAKELMREFGAEFVITGEVLGQRPMSQHRRALAIIEKDSGLSGLLLRPLSARLLDQTIPEKEGWVSREKLLRLNGRGRKAQIALARELKLEGYSNPAGGCLLTDARFSQRLRELMGHDELNLGNIELLKIGRHFRISPQAKLIVGRDEKENEILSSLAKEGDYLFRPKVLAGPTSLGRGILDAGLIKFSCEITSSYFDLEGCLEAELVYENIPQPTENLILVAPLPRAKLELFRI
jgi:tRNA-specific 2-thiouridylase